MNRPFLPLAAVLALSLGSALGNSPVYATEEQNEVRTWTASGGKYQTQARLVEIRPEEVVLEKTTGSRITVRRERLSEADRAYLDARQAATTSPAKKPEAAPADEALRREVRAELARVSEVPPAMKFEKIATLEGHTAPVAAVAISGDGSRVITCAENGDCRAWDLKTGRQVAKFEKPLEGKSFCVAITPDGRRGLVGGDFKIVHVWDTQTGKLLFSHDAAKAAITHVATYANGQWMLAAAANATILGFPILGGQGFTSSSARPEANVDQVAVRPDGRCALVISDQRSRTMRFLLPPAVPNAMAVPFSLPFPRASCGAMSARHIALAASVGRLYLIGVPQAAPEDSNTGLKYCSTRSTLTNFEQMTITPDDKLVAGMDRDGWVEFHDTAAPFDRRIFRIPIDDVSCMAPGADGITIAFGHRAGQVSVWRLPKAPLLSKARLVCTVFDYLRRREYDRLDAFAAEAARENAPFTYWSGCSRYSALLASLTGEPGVPDPAWNHDQELKDWLDHRPESGLAKMAVAQRLIEMAWEARGSGFADSVTEEGWRVFHANLAKAKDLIMPLIASPDGPVDAYRILFTIAKGESWERAEVDKHVEQMMRRAPAGYGAHEGVAEKLLQRWGGAPGDPEAYARKIADRVGGDAGAAVYARVALVMSAYYRSEDLRAEKFDYPRVRQGLAEVCRLCPDDPEPINGAMKWACVYGDKKTAREYLAKLEAHGEPWSFQHWSSYSTYLSAKSWATKD